MRLVGLNRRSLSAAIAGLGLAIGVVTLQAVGVLGQANEVEEFTPAQVEQYARVVLAVDPIRRQARERTNAAPDEATQSDIQRNFVRQATDIIERCGLSVPDYNRITIRLGEDAALKNRIEQVVRDLQDRAEPDSKWCPSPS